MKLLHALFLLVLPAAAQSATEEIAPKVKAAREILDPWHATEPKQAQKKLHIVLWTPRDRQPAARYEERLSAIMLDIQAF